MEAREFEALIVDDDPIVVHTIEGALRSLCTCRVALDGHRGLELMQRRAPDVVLLDVEMPGQSGFDVLRAMRSDASLSQVPAIMITSHADEQFHRRALDSGAVDFLAKPVSSTILLARVESHLRMSRAMRAMQQAAVSDRGDLETALRSLEASHQSLAAAAGKLDTANARLRQFMHVASHDLREPLNTIAQFANLIVSDHRHALPAPADRYLQHVVAGAQRMRVLLDDIVQYARVQEDLGQDMETVDLDALMQSLRDSLAGSLTGSGGQWELESLPRVRGVKSQLAMLFQCLLSNALKFHAPGQPPRVRVFAVPRDDQWEIHVTDRGIGIPAHAAARVLQPFARLHRRAQFDGSGLGLAIAQEIATQHGAAIEFSSVPDQGSDFWVRLKAA